MGGIDPRPEIVGAGHVGRANRVAIVQQSQQRVGSPGDPIEPCRGQNRPKLPTTTECGLETGPVIVLAAGHVGELGHQRPSLCRGKSPHAGLLCFKAEAALALLGGRHPVQPDCVALCERLAGH